MPDYEKKFIVTVKGDNSTILDLTANDVIRSWHIPINCESMIVEDVQTVTPKKEQ